MAVVALPKRDDGMPGAQAPAVGIGWRHPHYAELIERLVDIDFLEVHSENFFADGGASLAVLQRAREHYPVSLHGVGLSLGAVSGVDHWHLDQLARLVQRIEPTWVSDHACFARGLYAGDMIHGADLLPLPCTTEALNVLCANVQQVQDRLQRRLLVENATAYLNWKSDPDYPPMAEPVFLTELARRTGCGLLVDVNNIYVNAFNAQRAGVEGEPEQHCRQWLDAVPVEAVGEIHLAGHRHVSDQHGDIVIDDHGSRVCEAVWRLYRHALSRFGMVPTLIEWDTNIPALNVLLDEAARAREMGQAVWQAAP